MIASLTCLRYSRNNITRTAAPWDDGALDFLQKYPDASLSGSRLEIGKPPRHSRIDGIIQELLPDAEIHSGLIDGAQPVQRVPWLD